jgi:hypothetical protein
MRNRIFKSILTLILWLLIFSSWGFGQVRAEIYPVDISHDTLGWHISPCPLPGVSGDMWRFTNSTSDTVRLFIPICVGKQNTHFYIVAPGDSVDHLIGEEDWGVWVTVVPYGLVAHCARVHPPA